MDKKEAQNLTDTLYILDVVLRMHALEELLISKNICTREELQAFSKEASRDILKNILKNAKVPGDLDEIINNLQNKSFKQGLH